MINKTHALERISRKDGTSLFRCIQCGATDLLRSAVYDPCPNPIGMTREEAIDRTVRRGSRVIANKRLQESVRQAIRTVILNQCVSEIDKLRPPDTETDPLVRAGYAIGIEHALSTLRAMVSKESAP